MARKAVAQTAKTLKKKPARKRAPASRSTRVKGTTGVQLGESSARAMILQGAAVVFSKHGVRAASVEDILKAAGVSRRTFYRFYKNKEDVLVALYQFGTNDLLVACRKAVAQETDPVLQLQQCVDAHLRNARTHGRLMFVLGGEAQRHESALHVRRMEVHAELVTLLEQGAKASERQPLDALLYRALVLALEGVTRIVLQEGHEGRDVTDAGIDRVRQVMLRIATSALR